MKGGGGRCKCECAGGGGGGVALALESHATDYPASGGQPPTFSLSPVATPRAAPVPPRYGFCWSLTGKEFHALFLLREPEAPQGRGVGVGVGGLANSGFRIPLRLLAAALGPQKLRSAGVKRGKNAASQLRGHRALRVPIDLAVCPREQDSDRPPEPGAGA